MQTGSDKDGEVISEINVVPFVDVILVVLIIFLIVSPTFIKPGFDIQLPKAETAEKPKNVKALLSIDIEGSYYINKKPVEGEELAAELKKMTAQNKNMKAVIAADKNVAHGNVIALIDLVRKAGVTKFAVSIEPGQ